MERKGNPLKSWKLLRGNGENSNILLNHTLKSASFPHWKGKEGQEEQHSLIPLILSLSRNSSAAPVVPKFMGHP